MMELILWFLFALCIVGFAGALYILWRNGAVLDCRMEMIALLSEAAREDIFAGLPWEWRYQCFNLVPYQRMVYSFKPIEPESYWTDCDFLRFSRDIEERHAGDR